MQKRRLGRSNLEVRLERLDENLGALKVELTADDLREIERALATLIVKGARLSEQHMQLIDR